MEVFLPRNLPTRKYDVLKPERRVLVRQSDELLATGSSAVKTVKTPSLESAVKQVQDTIPSWKLERSANGVKLELYDNLHSLPKYTVLIHSSLEFTKAGINTENIENLREKTSSFSGVQRYVAIIMDEMKIQLNLVFDKNSGDLVGFIDLGDPMTNYANLQDDDTIATHALAFLARGLCTDMKHIVGYYFTGKMIIIQIDVYNMQQSLTYNILL